MVVHYEDAKIRKRIICENQHMFVTYDIPSPRPHLIVLLKNPYECKKVEDFVSRSDVIKSILSLADECPSAKILSLHTGYWYKANNFHAHLVLNTDDYLKEFEAAGLTLDNKDRTKEWSVTSEPLFKSYTENVKIYSEKQLKKCKSYKSADLKAIKELSNKPWQVGEASLWDNTKYKLVFHPNEPKIGFKSLNSKSQVDDFQAMVDFSHKLGLFGKEKGAHICLFLKKSDAHRDGFNDLSVIGYVLTSGIDYFKLFESYAQADVWKTNFIKNENFNVLT